MIYILVLNNHYLDFSSIEFDGLHIPTKKSGDGFRYQRRNDIINSLYMLDSQYVIVSMSTLCHKKNNIMTPYFSKYAHPKLTNFLYKQLS